MTWEQGQQRDGRWAIIDPSALLGAGSGGQAGPGVLGGHPCEGRTSKSYQS
jgi:hypothetical protein